MMNHLVIQSAARGSCGLASNTYMTYIGITYLHGELY